MKIRMGDIVDRLTITRLKVEHGLNLKDELKMLILETRGVSKKFINLLYKVNKIMWDIEVVAEKEKDLEKLGKLFKKQRILNKKRIVIKNLINVSVKDSEELKKFT
ncbi:MAG: hypothetical protein AAB922_03135 [Patescibacteria group bacterium]